MNRNDIRLFYAVIRNIRSKSMNRAMKGYTLKEKFDPISINYAKLFAEATADNNRDAYLEKGLAPPLLLAGLIMPMLKKILMHKDLNMNILRLVHAGQDIAWHKEIHIGDRIEAALSIEAISDVAAGELLSISLKANTDNSPALEGMVNIIVRGAKKQRKNTPKEEKENTRELFRLSIPTQDGQQLKYAEVTQDNNFIHLHR